MPEKIVFRLRKNWKNQTVILEMSEEMLKYFTDLVGEGAKKSGVHVEIELEKEYE